MSAYVKPQQFKRTGAEPMMKIVDADGFIYFQEGDSREEAVQSFGENIKIQHGFWQPRDNCS